MPLFRGYSDVPMWLTDGFFVTYVEGVILIVGGGKRQNIEDSSLVILSYQLLPLITSQNI